jgi:hypothetical protein|tara:strand:+ start:549 stop:905 length:357 start_codon:yes stop_codon:yes gene_type:complete
MERIKIIAISIVVLVVLVLGFYFISSGITKFTGLFVDEDILGDGRLIKCLSEKEVRVYVDKGESNNVLSELDYVDYLPYMDIFNCHNSEDCKGEGVVIEGFTYGLDMSLEELGMVLEC